MRRSAAVLLSAVLLLALALSASAQGPPGPPGPTGPPSGPSDPTPTAAPEPTAVPTPQPTAAPGDDDSVGGDVATEAARINCSTNMVFNATPICLADDGENLHVYFIGDKSDAFPTGVAQAMALSSVGTLAKTNPAGSGNVVLWQGKNPVSGATVIISYLSDDRLLHFHTYTWDRHEEGWKPYIFVLDENNTVTPWQT